MPVRFTCRVSVFRAPSGKFRLRYAPLNIMHAPPEETPVRLLTINGPSMIIPPDAEMTAAELDRWEFATVHETGCSYTFEMTPGNAPLVEAHRTIEDLIPKGSVKWQFQELEDRAGRRTFGIVLRSTWRGQIPRFSLATCWENESPQIQPGMPAHLGVRELSGSESVFHRMTPIGMDALPPNIEIPFAYDARSLDSFLSRMASLSPERYWISLLTEGHEFDRIPGPQVSAFLDTLGK